MANAQLIQMAKDLAKSEGYVDVADAVDKGFEAWNTALETKIAERKLGKEKADARMIEYMDKMPNIGIEKIPKYMQPKVVEWAKSQRAAYAEHARAIGDLDPDMPEYAEHVNAMNDIKSSYVNLDDQLVKLMEMKEDEMELVDGADVSNANNPSDRDFYTQALTDSASVSLDGTGTLLFDRDGTGVGVNELPRTVPFASGLMTEYTALNKAIVGSKQPLGDITTPEGKAQKENMRMEVVAMLKKHGRKGVQSAAADHISKSGDDPFAIDSDLLFNPERKDELFELVAGYYTESLWQAGKSSYEQSQVVAEDKKKLDKKYRAPATSSTSNLGIIDQMLAKMGQTTTTTGDPVTSGGPTKPVKEVDAMSTSDFKNFIIGMSAAEQAKYGAAQMETWTKKLQGQ